MAFLATGCSLFEPRDPEDPSRSSSNFVPPTRPEIVITNLQNAVAEKNADNYVACFADPARSNHSFRFTPTAEATAQYPGIMSDWSITDEMEYFRALVARSDPGRFSNLILVEQSRIVTADSVMYNFDYELTFEHNDPGFPTTVSGNLQFSLAPDNSSFWSIYQWSDFAVGGNEVTWSMMKGRFSN